MFETNSSRDNEIVEIKLSIGQSKLIGRLVDAELALCEAGISTYNEKSLQALTDVFMSVTRETEEERQVRFGNWVRSVTKVGLNHG